jgi:hypothetical protein
LWLDEGITAYKMSLSIQKLLLTQVDNVPPLYYLVLPGCVVGFILICFSLAFRHFRAGDYPGAFSDWADFI